jgi:hypothetical protein
MFILVPLNIVEMELIKITANGIILDYKKDTLSIRKENNSFSTDFKVSHSSYPFLIIENESTVKALGPRDITSINKKKLINVKVEESGVLYTGELHVLSYIPGFRKCNLKYASETLPIMNKKLAEFMPVVSIIPDETTPVPFTEESAELVEGSESWISYAVNFIDKNYPEVKYQFPTMYWKNKFGVGLESDDPWFGFKNFINKFTPEFDFEENTYNYVTPSNIEVLNQNVISPQVFLLSPIFYALNSIGFTLNGQFQSNELIKRILLLSFKNNLTKVILKPEITDVVFDGSWVSDPIGLSLLYRKTEIFPITDIGTYTVKLRFVLPLQEESEFSQPIYTSLRMKVRVDSIIDFDWNKETLFNRKLNSENEVIEGEFTVEIKDWSGSSQEIYFYYYNKDQIMPVEYDLKFYKSDAEKEYHQFHPTIELGRYVPDLTLGSYLNELKKLLNLKFDTDDSRKTFTIDFVENQILSAPLILNKSMKIDDYDLLANTSFVLKFNNQTDSGIYITTEGVELLQNQTNDFTKTISSGFKIVPSNGITAELSESLESKQGVGLMIYNPESMPYVSEKYQGQTLKLDGAGGVYESFWKKTLKIRLSASGCDVAGAFTKTEINKLIQSEDVYFDLQHFKIVLLDYSEDSASYFWVKMKLESVNL